MLTSSFYIGNSYGIFRIKKAVFYSDKIILLRKKGNVTIYNKDIASLRHAKPNLWNFIEASWFCGIRSGCLFICLNQKIGEKTRYAIKIKYKDFLKLPKNYIIETGVFNSIR